MRPPLLCGFIAHHVLCVLPALQTLAPSLARVILSPSEHCQHLRSGTGRSQPGLLNDHSPFVTCCNRAL